MAKASLYLRYLSFVIVFFFIPFSLFLTAIAPEEQGNVLTEVLTKYVYVATLFCSVSSLAKIIFLTLAKRKEAVAPYKPFTFYSVLFAGLSLSIISITLLNTYIDKTIFYLVLVMTLIRLFEIKFFYFKQYRLNIIFAIIFDTLAGCLSFELIRPMPILPTLLLSFPLASLNGALLASFHLNAFSKKAPEATPATPIKTVSKKQHQERKNKNSSPQLSTESTTKTLDLKHLIKSYQFLTLLPPLAFSVCVFFGFVLFYHYLTFLIVFPATHIYLQMDQAFKNGQEMPKKVLLQTTFIFLAFVTIMIVAEILTQNFPVSMK